VYRRTAALLGGIALAVAMPTATSTAAPVARIACTHATIGGQSKCIARGQFCSRSHASQYRRYGFKCAKRVADGHYRLTT
jgi:hypothetical protein